MANGDIDRTEPVVVHLIHGTWPKGVAYRWLPKRLRDWLAPDPAWHERGSAFRADLESCCGLPITFRSFLWSGRNSHAARLEAAEGFRRFLAHQVQADPDKRHFVIAHSHGGNVALMGLARSDVSTLRRVAGVATMATPFLHADPFQGTRFERAARIMPLLFLPMVGLSFVVVQATAPALAGMGAFWLSLSLSAVLTTLLAIGLALGAATSLLALRRLRLNGVREVKANLLIVRATGDEATLMLAGAQFASTVIAFAWDTVYRPLFSSADRYPWLVMLGYLSCVFACVFLVWSPETFRTAPWAIRLLVTGAVLATATMVLSCLVILPAAMVQAIVAGPGAFFSFFLNELRVEATPPNWEGVVVCVKRTHRELRTRRMNHSVHELQRVRARLAEWIDAAVASRSPWPPP